MEGKEEVFCVAPKGRIRIVGVRFNTFSFGEGHGWLGVHPIARPVYASPGFTQPEVSSHTADRDSS